ncbi:MAG TPA: Ldh family oxidoreductase [Pirellulales bacterium]|nr:Ldh family oxidoreductase [Pirellulales bacterium]
MVNIPVDKLTQFSEALLLAGGVSVDEAQGVAKSLVMANLLGHDSHGVMRIPYYLDGVSKGEVKPGAPFTVIKQLSSLLQADGNWGFGQTQARRLTERLIGMARESGVALGTLFHTGHIGRLGEYCQQAAEAGMVSLVMVNTHGVARRVAPPGGKAPRLGTNPIAIGVPHPDGTLLMDFGTSATAEGKVRVKRIAGQPCPDGWLLDSEGRPTNDPNSLYGDPPGTIRPFGGDQPHKGFALGLMVEIFAGALSGGVCIREKPINQLGNCVFAIVVDPRHVGGAEHVAREVLDLVKFVRGCPKADGVNEILLPGDPERKTAAVRQSTGIPLDDGNWAALAKLAETLKVPLPG